jgi:hypothetical protein
LADAVVTPGSSRTPLNAAVVVTVVAAPGAGVRRHVLCLRYAQLDNAARNLYLLRNIGGTSRVVDQVLGQAPGLAWVPVDREHPIILTGTDTLEGQADAVTTTNPDVHAEWIDFTPNS